MLVALGRWDESIAAFRRPGRGGNVAKNSWLHQTLCFDYMPGGS